jgi:hypothetical protein
MSAPFHKIDIARTYLQEFPHCSKCAIARLLFRDHPKLWTTLEAARRAVQSATGRNGKKNREDYAHQELYQAGAYKFPELPEGITHFEDWKCYSLDGPARILDLPDVHIPYHDRNVLKLAIEHGIDYDPTHVLLSGDFIDFFSISFWEKDPRERDLGNELRTANEVLDYLQCVFPSSKFVFKEGNHEERWRRYIIVKAPELFGLDQFSLSQALRLKERGIDLVTDKRPIKTGHLYIIHGHEFKWGVSNPVNPARGFYLRAKTNCIGHHLHQSSSHSEKDLPGEIVSTWSTGCLCELHPDYAPINKWNNGFATINVEADGYFEVRNLKILEGRIFEG